MFRCAAGAEGSSRPPRLAWAGRTESRSPAIREHRAFRFSAQGYSRRASGAIGARSAARSTVDRVGYNRQLNGERRLKPESELRRFFGDYPEVCDNTWRIAKACTFSLDEPRYGYPEEITDGMEPNKRLRKLTEEGLVRRYPKGVSDKVRAMLEKEMGVIAKLDYARYFLTLHDMVQFDRSKRILCQGRGSATNSVVCYILGITEASPDMIAMVFDRFISEVRDEPPDIDVDFEHEHREEVVEWSAVN